MRALVTGANGFIGSGLCRALLAEGHSVRAFHRTESSLVNLAGLDVEHFLGDVLDGESLKRAMEGTEWVFHTAATVGKAPPVANPYAATTEGIRHALTAAREAGVNRFILTSSVAALGVPAPGEIMDETHQWNYTPRLWPYGWAKKLAEQVSLEAAQNGQDVVIVNPASVVGAGDLHRISGGIVYHAAKGRGVVSVPGGLNIVHIDDVVAGHLAAAKTGRAGERYILGGHNLPMTDILRTTARITGGRPPLVELPLWLCRALTLVMDGANRAFHLRLRLTVVRMAGRFFYYDTSKARRELGLGEPRSWADAVREAWEWYRERGLI